MAGEKKDDVVKLDKGVFHAEAIIAMRCTDPKCQCVHILLFDGDKEVRAQARMPIANAMQLMIDIAETTQEIACDLGLAAGKRDPEDTIGETAGNG